MKKYKLLACDVDGTLINDFGQIIPSTLEAIRMILDKRVNFVISSGRGLVGLRFITNLFDQDLPCITFNGALVITSRTKKKIFEKCLDASDALKLIEFANNHNITFVAWQGEDLLTNQINQRVLEYATISKVNPQEKIDFTVLAKEGLHKILFYDEVEKIKDYQYLLDKEEFINIDYYTSLPYFLEFVNRDASKAIGLEEIGRAYNILQTEMIAIGDGFNDLSMIKYAGLGVAMENAPDKIKEQADFITRSNNDEGVKFVIDKFILNE